MPDERGVPPFAVTLLACTFVFAVTFAVAGGGIFAALALFSPEPPRDQKFLTGLLFWMFGLYAAFQGLWLGALTGALYSLIPPRARDVWMAAALGIGVVAFASALAGSFPDFLILIGIGVGAVASMAASVILRRTTRAL